MKNPSSHLEHKIVFLNLLRFFSILKLYLIILQSWINQYQQILIIVNKFLFTQLFTTILLIDKFNVISTIMELEHQRIKLQTKLIYYLKYRALIDLNSSQKKLHQNFLSNKSLRREANL